MSLPQDPVILLSYINTQLRDYYNTLEELCKSLCIEKESLITKLSEIDYHYNEKNNQFV